MLWKHQEEGLQYLPVSRKIALTIFLCVVAIGYIFGFLNIAFTYGANDGEPGMSLRDIEIAFYGAREKTALERSIDGSMRPYFQTEEGYNTTKAWLAEGAKEVEFEERIKPIFDRSCNSCHAANVRVADVALETFEDTEPYLTQDTGKPISRLVAISHTHILALVVVVFLLVSIICATMYPQWLKVTLCAWSYFTILLDVGGWWLAKLSPSLSFMVIVGGASLGTSWTLLIALPLYELWFKKATASEQNVTE